MVKTSPTSPSSVSNERTDGKMIALALIGLRPQTEKTTSVCSWSHGNNQIPLYPSLTCFKQQTVFLLSVSNVNKLVFLFVSESSSSSCEARGASSCLPEHRVVLHRHNRRSVRQSLRSKLWRRRPSSVRKHGGQGTRPRRLPVFLVLPILCSSS